MAVSLGRAPSTISREIRRNGGRQGYRAGAADQAAWDRARRPKSCRLVLNARASLEDLHASVFDATPVLARNGGEHLYLPFDGHLTAEGNRLVAEALLARWPLACRADAGAPP